MKKCIKCNSVIDDNELNCPICGFDFSQCNKCPKCGKEYLGFSYICSYCGTPLYNNILNKEMPDNVPPENSVISESKDINTHTTLVADCQSVNSEKHTSDKQDSQPLVSVRQSDDNYNNLPDDLSDHEDSQNDFQSYETDTDDDIIILDDDIVKESENADSAKNETDKKQYSRRHVSYSVGKQVKTDNTKRLNLVNEPEDVENEE